MFSSLRCERSGIGSKSSQFVEARNRWVQYGLWNHARFRIESHRRADWPAVHLPATTYRGTPQRLAWAPEDLEQAPRGAEPGSQLSGLVFLFTRSGLSVHYFTSFLYEFLNPFYFSTFSSLNFVFNYYSNNLF